MLAIDPHPIIETSATESNKSSKQKQIRVKFANGDLWYIYPNEPGQNGANAN